MMNHTILARILFPLLSASLISLGLLQSAFGAVVSTERAMQMSERTAQIERISAILAEQQVRDQLVRFGVDPQDAATRVAALSDSELQALAQRVGELPAGANGALEVIGIVMLVLLILELVGVTDIFKSF
ncbi:MAG TPA: PA2779 family protein [Woeseiaceae bacterium]